MAVGVANRTLQLVIKEALRLGGWIINEGTSTAGTTTSLTDASRERTPVAQANAVAGTYLWMFAGDGAGQQAEINAYATIGVMPWTPALTSPGANTDWVRCRIRPQRVIDAVDAITRGAWRKQAFPMLFYGIVTNSLLSYNGGFAIWTSGASSAPDGWTLAGTGATIARISPSAYGAVYDLYAAEITSGAGAVGTLTYTVATQILPLLNGQTVTLQGRIAEDVAADIVIRVAATNSAGTVTNTDRTGTLASDRWQTLKDISSAGISLPNPVVALTLAYRGVASVVGNVDDLMLLGPPLYDYEIPADFIGLEPIIYMETGYLTQKFTIPLYFGADWNIMMREPSTSTARVLHFNRALPSGRHLRIAAFRAPDVISTMSSNVEPNPEWLAYATAERVLAQERMTEENKYRLEYLRQELGKFAGTSEGNVMLGKPIVWIESR